MSDKSAIEWTDATWNPVTGCSKVRPAAPTATRRPLPSASAGCRATRTSRASIFDPGRTRLELAAAWRGPRTDLRQLHERSFHEASRSATSASLRGRWRSRRSTVPGAHEARMSRLADSSAGPAVATNVDGRERRERRTRWIAAPTTCARFRPPCDSSAPSRCSGHFTARSHGDRLADRGRGERPRVIGPRRSDWFRDLRRPVRRGGVPSSSSSGVAERPSGAAAPRRARVVRCPHSFGRLCQRVPIWVIRNPRLSREGRHAGIQRFLVPSASFGQVFNGCCRQAR